MFEKQTKEQATEQILNSVKEYYKKFMVKPEYKNGDRIPYAGRVFDEKEMMNLVDSALEFWLTNGRYTDEFEKQLGEYLGIQYVSLVNSGSSANLLAFMALTSPILKERQIKRGDEVITIAAGFPTTITPILQYGAIPVFVDITIPQYNVDVAQLEESYSEKTKAVMLAHTLGNPFDLKAVKEFCNKHNLWLIEDNCDALGSEYNIDGKMFKTGTIGDIGTSSFYPPHHITMGEGGAVYTANPLLNKIIRSMRDWGRDCVCPSGFDNMCGHRFDHQYSQLPFGYDHKYVYSNFGYNFKATDLQAAIGCAQLEKLPSFIQKRKNNWGMLKDKLSAVSDKIILPEAAENSNPSWFGFMMCCRPGIDRNRLTQNLEKEKIQTRMLFAGNIIKHPCFDLLRSNRKEYKVIGDLPNTDYIMNNGFWIGVYPGLTEAMIEKISMVVKKNIQNEKANSYYFIF